MSGRGGRALREGRGEFVRKKEKSGRDAADLFAVTEQDIENELQSIIKTTERIEKNIKRLTEEEKVLAENEEKWQAELDNLTQLSRTTLERIEEKTRKEQFEWTRELKIEEAKIERLIQRLDTLESELESKTEKREEKERGVQEALLEELAGLEKSFADSAGNTRRLEAEFAKLSDDKKKLEEGSTRATKETDKINKLLEIAKTDKGAYDKQLEESLAKDEVLKKEVTERDELEEAIAQAKKDLKNLDKASTKNKEEATEMEKLRKQIQEAKEKNKTLEEDLEKSEQELKEVKSSAKQGKANTDSSTTTDTSSRRAGNTDNATEEAEEAKSDAQKQIEELERELSKAEFDWNEAKVELEYEIKDLQMEEDKAKSQCDRLKTELLALEKELNTNRDNHTKDEREKLVELKRLEDECKTDIRAIENLTKDLAKLCTRELNAAKTTLQNKQLEVTNLNQQIEVMTFVSNFMGTTEARIEKEGKEIADRAEMVKAGLKDTEENLKQAREELAKVNDEMKEFMKKHEAIIQKNEEELFKESGATDVLLKKRDNLRLEIRRLRAYIDRKGARKGEEGAADDDGQALIKEEMYIAKLVEERKNDLQKIKNQLHQLRPKDDRTLSELTDTFHRLVKEDKERWEEVEDFIWEFHQELKRLNVKQREVYQALVDLMEHKVHEGVIIALSELLVRQREGKLRTPVGSALSIMWMCKRDVKSGLIDDEDYEMRKHKHGKYSDALLRRLADERCLRTNKLRSYCELVILEGGEDWPIADYAEFVEEEKVLAQEEEKKREAEKKKIEEQKVYWKKKKEERNAANSK